MIAGFGFRNSVVENSFDELKEKYMTKYKIDFIATTLDKSKNKAFTNFAKNNNFKIILVNSYKLTEVETLSHVEENAYAYFGLFTQNQLLSVVNMSPEFKTDSASFDCGTWLQSVTMI